MQFARIHLLAIGVLQLFTDILDIHHIFLVHEHLRIKGCIATETLL